MARRRYASENDKRSGFAREKSQDAFTELVQRKVNLVYSAALRQVRSPQLAEEVAQSVFADLAHSADKLGSGTGFSPVESLTPWLYAVTRRTAIDVIRKESRRQLREQIAVELNAMNATENSASVPPAWSEIEPLLDEAVSALGDIDRTAVLLRYFENKSLREVGQQLGVSDDAAQKRVSRAVEHLREFFSKRNVTIGASGLAAVIAANAVQAAPAGLAVTISTAALLTGTAVSTSTIIAATKTIVMTTLQKTVITAAFVATAGAGIFEAQQAAQLREQNQMLKEQQVPLAEQIQQLQHERDDATNRLAGLIADNARLKSNPNQTELLKLRGEVTQMRNQPNDPTGSAVKSLLGKVNKLKQRLEEAPDAKIPELQFLTEQNWLNAASGKLETDIDYRRALASLRSAAENTFASMLQPALSKYLQANNGQFPTDLFQLQPFFASPVDAAILQRWEVTSPKTIPNLGVGETGIITEKVPVDDVFDTRIAVGSSGYGNVDFLTTETQDALIPVYKAFVKANGGQEPADISQVLPYATTPEQQAAIQKMMLRKSADTSH
jgi:RNA polymerase sigma factor (sigma-70 family)